MFDINLLDSKGQTSYLSVKGRSSWKTKRTAIKHATDIANCKNKPFDVVAINIENEFGETVKTIL